MASLLSSDLMAILRGLQVCGQYEDDMVGQSFFIDENSAVGFCAILQAQNFVVDIGGVEKGFLG